MFGGCAQPGGALLCLTTWCCACITGGRNNEGVEGPAGFIGGCLIYGWFWIGVILAGAFVHLRYIGVSIDTLAFLGMFIATMYHADKTMKKINPNNEISCCKSCLKAWFCMGCYLCQIRREQIKSTHLLPIGAAPTQYTVPNQTVVVQQPNPMVAVPAPTHTVVVQQQPQPVMVQQQPVVVTQQQPQVVVTQQQPVQYV